jgi:serine/threonine protein kinase
MSGIDPEAYRKIEPFLDELFEAGPESRAALIEKICGNDKKLRSDLEALLEAEACKEGSLDTLAGGENGEETAARPATAGEGVTLAGERLGSYHLIRKIGEGGMGVVYEAEQKTPRRRVALKVLRGESHDDEDRLRLFEREIETLARLDHPGIAAIHEAGRTTDGHHFFSMELVPGIPLDEYLQSRHVSKHGSLSAEEISFRLQLFLKICDAIGYAHQRGVLHRDLKPSNILVIEAGTESSDPARGAQIKILDFGLARITDEEIDRTRTTTGTVRGTLPYMSPEQARGDPDRVDVRSDLYALGVVLFEMLTGELPYEPPGKSVLDLVRTICETPPRRPSELITSLRGDLETILLTTLEKEPEDRYSSVPALAEDLRRYLAMQPILAKPPSTLYQLRKMVARHRTGFTLVTALILLLILGTAGTTIGMLRARAEEAKAREEAARVQLMSDFLEDIFQSAGDPYRTGGKELTVMELLENAIERVDDQMEDDPIVQARLRFALARIYTELGLYDEARPLLEQSLAFRREHFGPGHKQTVAIAVSLSWNLQQAGRFEEMRDLLRQTLVDGEQVLGPADEQMIALRTNLATAEYSQGNLSAARDLFAENLLAAEHSLPRGHRTTQALRINLGATKIMLGEYAEARRHFERFLATRKEKGLQEDPSVPTVLVNLAAACDGMGDSQAAVSLADSALRVAERVLGPDHPNCAPVCQSLGKYRVACGDYQKGRADLERAYTLFCEGLGERSWRAGSTLTDLAGAEVALENHEAARKLAEEALSILEEAFGPDHPEVAAVLYELGLALKGLGERDRAIESFERSLRIREEVLGPESSITQKTRARRDELLEETHTQAPS